MADERPDNSKAEALATETGVLDLYSVSLIGTTGAEDSRRALVRMPSGRIDTLMVGDMLRGRRIDAIEPARLLMSRNGDQSVLDMPKG